MRISALCLAILLFVVTCLLPISIKSFESEVTLQVPANTIVFEGYSSPNAIISVRKNGVTLGTTGTDQNGYFIKYLYDQPEGNHTYRLISVDSDGQASEHILVVVPVYNQMTTTVADILFTPTYSLSTYSTNLTEALLLSGKAKPFATITIFFEHESGNFAITTQADQNGWSTTYTFQNPGTYRGRIRASGDQGRQSDFSSPFEIQVTGSSSQTESSVSDSNNLSPTPGSDYKALEIIKFPTPRPIAKTSQFTLDPQIFPIPSPTVQIPSISVTPSQPPTKLGIYLSVLIMLILNWIIIVWMLWSVRWVFFSSIRED